MRRIFITLLSFFLLVQELQAQQFNVLGKWMEFSDAPNALYHHLSAQAYKLLDARKNEIAKLNTLSGWKSRQELIDRTLRNVVGPFPEKTALKARINKIIHKKEYKVEHVVYQSRPGFYVSSSLFIPNAAGKDNAFPAIIYCSGHSNNGYRSVAYMRAILNLVKKGFIVFAFDPVGQGERLEYYNPETGKSLYKWPAWEHSYVGAQVFLTGGSLANYMIWDGIRAVDYLLSRKEVDAARIGITGRSGGGTQSAFIAALDERIKAVAPENYITSFTRLFQSIGPQDAEQDFFNGIKKGLDMADLLLVRAPKPALMITTTQDMFSIQGSRETAAEVAVLYETYDKSENFSMVTDDAAHASTKKNREAMYAFFQKHLDNPGIATDEEVELLTDEELKVSSTGQLATAVQQKTVFDLNAQLAEELTGRLQTLRKSPAYFSALLDDAKRLSGYQEPISPAQPAFTGQVKANGYTIEKYFVKGEGDYVIPYLLMKPDQSNHKAVLYLHPSGKLSDAAPGGDMEWFAKNGFTVLAPDLIGTGEVGPGMFKGDSYVDSVSYNVWFASILTGRSIVGIQAGDVVRLSHLLKQDTLIKEVYALAKKQMAPVLLHAAAFDKSIVRIALISSYSSYRSIATSRFYKLDFIQSTVAGSLSRYDLPDLAASLAPRKLLLFGVTDGSGAAGDTIADMKVISNAYQLKENQLQIVPAKSDDTLLSVSNEKLTESLKSWIK